VQSGFSQVQAISASLGFGLINFVFALPAVFTIDRFGRRNLLLTTFPLMALCLLLSESHIALTATMTRIEPWLLFNSWICFVRLNSCTSHLQLVEIFTCSYIPGNDARIGGTWQ
jgi:MFS family permease